MKTIFSKKITVALVTSAFVLSTVMPAVVHRQIILI